MGHFDGHSVYYIGVRVQLQVPVVQSVVEVGQVYEVLLASPALVICLFDTLYFRVISVIYL